MAFQRGVGVFSAASNAWGGGASSRSYGRLDELPACSGVAMDETADVDGESIEPMKIGSLWAQWSRVSSRKHTPL